MCSDGPMDLGGNELVRERLERDAMNKTCRQSQIVVDFLGG